MKKLIFFLASFLFAINFPTLTGRVVDEANILSPQTKQLLEQKLKNFEQNTSNQIVVVTLKSLQGHSIEEYGYQLGRHWGIGQKDKNNGVLLIVAPNERKVRIEVGYGLEGTLTDAKSFLIINDIIIPYFKKGDFDTGVIKGTEAIMETIKGTFKPDKKNQNKDDSFPIIAFGIIFLSVILSRFVSFLRRYLSAIFFAAFASIPAYYMFDSLIIAIIVATIVFIVAAIFFKPPPPGDASIIDVDNHYPHSTLGGFGGGDFGSGGFSGGGGGFGGGGSSGSW